MSLKGLDFKNFHGPHTVSRRRWPPDRDTEKSGVYVDQPASVLWGPKTRNQLIGNCRRLLGTHRQAAGMFLLFE